MATDITITAYDSQGSQADLDITVDGADYTATWDDDDGLLIMGTPDLSDAVQAEVEERVKLFFTFYDEAALAAAKAELTAEAQAAVEDHLARNAAAL